MRPVSFLATRTGLCCCSCFVHSNYFFLANFVVVHWCFHGCFFWKKKMKCLLVVGVVVWGRLGCLVGGSGVW